MLWRPFNAPVNCVEDSWGSLQWENGMRDNGPSAGAEPGPKRDGDVMLCYVMVPLLHTHQRRKQLGVVASCDIRQWEVRSYH
jgi:hypothetical protein